jgi:hypothetical protein
MPRFAILVACAASIVATTVSAHAQVNVTANANVYGAGHATAPGPGGAGGGILPVLVEIPPGTGRTVTFAFSGVVDYGGCCPSNGPDGIAVVGAVAHSLYGGIAGCDLATRARYFAGVFVDDTEPADPSPSSLTIPDISFTELSPDLRQVFFIGDGLTGEGSGTTQVVHVPDDATRLFLGYQDRCSVSPNLPGWYDDNSGTVTGTVTFDTPTTAGRVPVGTLLSQNAPNPFTHTTAIRFSSPVSHELTVYDVVGRRVQTLHRGAGAGGETTVLWNGRNARGEPVGSGVYYYRLKTADGTVTRRMIVVR